jgi:uncharacterized protein (DUF488 family)
MIERILTIGAHGYDQAAFLAQLREAGADLFVDIRARRGMRGSQYAFANSARLQAALLEQGVRYVHARELAPPEEVRAAQAAADARDRIAKRQRTRLSEEFIRDYRQQCLSKLDSEAFVRSYCEGCRAPVLFCVEREPQACHRWLLADRLAADLGVSVEHLMP